MRGKTLTPQSFLPGFKDAAGNGTQYISGDEFKDI
jgi:hypothetical protein